MADPAKESLQRIETKKRGLFKKFAERVRAEKNTTYRIFVEGNDNIGKSTACEKIYNYFTELGLSVKLISFPDYNTETGTLIKKIYREYSIDERHPEMDMYLHKANVREVLFNQVGKDKEEYDVIIFDRSPISNFLYHASLPFHSKYTVYSSQSDK
jgi:thymidylate kinase